MHLFIIWVKVHVPRDLKLPVSGMDAVSTSRSTFTHTHTHTHTHLNTRQKGIKEILLNILYVNAESDEIDKSFIHLILSHKTRKEIRAGRNLYTSSPTAGW